MLNVSQFGYGSDNYAVLLHDPETEACACVDAGDGDAVLQALAAQGWTLSELWITHHHWDHTDGLEKVKSATGCTVRGPEGVAGVDQVLRGGDRFEFAGRAVQVLHTPGHTLDMLNFHIPVEKLVFTGDTLFVMGCGRLTEGDPAMMWASLQKLMALPEDTAVYCSHEYTLANGAFALSVDGENDALKQAVKAAQAARAKGQPTVPSTMAKELATNPFLRPHDPAIRAGLGLEDASDAEVFTALRAAKDRF